LRVFDSGDSGPILAAGGQFATFDGNSHFLITVTPAPEAATLRLEIDLGCGAATGTKHYRLIINAGSGPGSVVLVFEDNGASDAGAD
jgi:hypothetical protein